MRLNTEILVVGGGTGGVAAALAACRSGRRVVLTDPFSWLGGQLTSQAVPPDEHPWIERFGCTATYREFRNRVRGRYRSQGVEGANPGGGWVSKLCLEPRVGAEVLEEMLAPYRRRGLLLDFRRTWPKAVELQGDQIKEVVFETGRGDLFVSAPQVIDASELGDLLPMANLPHRVGAEGQGEFGEPHAPEKPLKNRVQAFTWVAALGLDPTGASQVGEPPEMYEHWLKWKPAFADFPILDFRYVNLAKGKVIEFPLFGSEGQLGWFEYRQVVPYGNDLEPVTLVNWPQNDYYERNYLDESVAPEDVYYRARQLTLSLVHWLQTEAPRPDGGRGWPNLRLRPDVTGSSDGLAQSPYIREARRIVSHRDIREQDLVAGEDFSVAEMEHSIGIGAYRLDIHPCTDGSKGLDLSSRPFQLPMGCLIPQSDVNLLAGAKNIGVSQIANGCTRLHPVEWNLGEAAGALAAYCLEHNARASDVIRAEGHREAYLAKLDGMGIERHWPSLRAL
jgi:hypothetical protein